MVMKDRFSKVMKKVGDGTANLAKAVGDGAAKAAQKSEKMVKISKHKLSISANEKKIENNYAEIGRKVYEKFTQGETTDLDLLDICMDIAELENSILQLKQEIEELKTDDDEDDLED
jgi:hypothetical protein